jgi:hypothetical protein
MGQSEATDPVERDVRRAYADKARRANLVLAARAVADMLDSKPLGLDEGDLALLARLRRALGDE